MNLNIRKNIQQNISQTSTRPTTTTTNKNKKQPTKTKKKRIIINSSSSCNFVEDKKGGVDRSSTVIAKEPEGNFYFAKFIFITKFMKTNIKNFKLYIEMHIQYNRNNIPYTFNR